MTGKRALYRRKPCTITPCSVLYLVGIYNCLAPRLDYYCIVLRRPLEYCVGRYFIVKNH